MADNSEAKSKKLASQRENLIELVGNQLPKLFKEENETIDDLMSVIIKDVKDRKDETGLDADKIEANFNDLKSVDNEILKTFGEIIRNKNYSDIKDEQTGKLMSEYVNGLGIELMNLQINILFEKCYQITTMIDDKSKNLYQGLSKLMAAFKDKLQSMNTMLGMQYKDNANIAQ